MWLGLTSHYNLYRSSSLNLLIFIMVQFVIMYFKVGMSGKMGSAIIVYGLF